MAEVVKTNAAAAALFWGIRASSKFSHLSVLQVLIITHLASYIHKLTKFIIRVKNDFSAMGSCINSFEVHLL